MLGVSSGNLSDLPAHISSVTTCIPARLSKPSCRDLREQSRDLRQQRGDVSEQGGDLRQQGRDLRQQGSVAQLKQGRLLHSFRLLKELRKHQMSFLTQWFHTYTDDGPHNTQHHS